MVLALAFVLAVATAARPASRPRLHTIRMGQDSAGRVAFVPATLTIAPGDTVEFLPGRGGPHNVAFEEERLPPGAAAVLRAAMADTIAALSGPLVLDGERYRIAFTGAPRGTYPFYCLPHRSIGMVGTLTVR